MDRGKHNNILELICNTPIVKLNRIAPKGGPDIYAKMEYFNPGGSVKDRICLSMINAAEADGLLNKDSVVVEPTSGNTGIGLALVCAVKGYKLILTMPDSMSLERRNLLKAYGSELVLTPGSEGMKGAIEKATKLVEENDNYFMPQQFKNPTDRRKSRLLRFWCRYRRYTYRSRGCLKEKVPLNENRSGRARILTGFIRWRTRPA